VHKNIGPFLAFNQQWFAKNQRLLLWLLNAPIIKIWFRWVFRIRQHDCPLKTRITDIQPNNFSFGDRYFKKKGKWFRERTTDFRTHPKFGKRAYYAFRPFWWTIHAWDWLIADRFVPRLSYGFSTLTQFPGSTGTDNPVDGVVGVNPAGSSWASIRAAAGDDAQITNTIDDSTLLQTNASAQYIHMYRAIHCFNTAALTSGASISSAVLSHYVFALLASANVAGYSIDHCSPASTTNLSNSDYNIANWDSVKQATDIAQASITTGAYNDWTLNATGIGNISKTGITKFGLRSSNDLTNTDPIFGNGKTNSLETYMSNQGATTNDPKLVLTYTTATTYTQTLTESATMSASLLKSAARTLVEALTMSDVLASIRIKFQTLVESFTGTDTVNKASVRNLTESATMSATVPRATGRSLTEAPTLSDTVNKGPAQVHTEQATISDTVLKAEGRILSESATITATLLKAGGKVLSEALTMADFILKGITKLMSEVLSIQDLVTRIINGLLALYSNKYSKRNTDYGDKNSSRGTSYTDKYHHLE
jgi:hypothetical protein